jgi:hypothetical protein
MWYRGDEKMIGNRTRQRGDVTMKCDGHRGIGANSSVFLYSYRHGEIVEGIERWLVTYQRRGGVSAACAAAAAAAAAKQAWRRTVTL